MLLHADSDQTGLSLRLPLTSFCWFCRATAQLKQRELPILLAAHCPDKIHIFVKFRLYILYGSEVYIDKKYVAKDR